MPFIGPVQYTQKNGRSHKESGGRELQLAVHHRSAESCTFWYAFGDLKKNCGRHPKVSRQHCDRNQRREEL